MSHWTPDEKDQLRRLIAENPTMEFSLIAKIIGRPRNACIGQAHRLGLSKPRPVSTPKPVRLVTPKPSVLKMVLLQRSAPPPPRVFPDMPVPLVDLRRGMCRWLHAGGLYCGKETTTITASFCEAHAKKVYNRGEPPGPLNKGVRFLRKLGGSPRA